MTVLTTIKTALTADTRPAITGFLTKKINIFGATIPLNKKVTKKVVELATVAALAIGIFGTQVYVYVEHKKAIELNSGRTATLESLAKQTDTSFVNVNAAIIATNKIVNSVQVDQAVTDAKVTALAAQLAAVNAKLTPVRPTSVVTRKYYRKK